MTSSAFSQIVETFMRFMPCHPRNPLFARCTATLPPMTWLSLGRFTLTNTSNCTALHNRETQETLGCLGSGGLGIMAQIENLDYAVYSRAGQLN